MKLFVKSIDFSHVDIIEGLRLLFQRVSVPDDEAIDRLLETFAQQVINFTELFQILSKV